VKAKEPEFECPVDETKPANSLADYWLKDRRIPKRKKDEFFVHLYWLAKKRLGKTHNGMAYAMGLGSGGNYSRGRQRLLSGERMSWSRVMALAEMAGIPKAYAAVMYARTFVPDEYQKYIGCTVLPGRRKSPWRMDPAEYRKLRDGLCRVVPLGRNFPDPTRVVRLERLNLNKQLKRRAEIAQTRKEMETYETLTDYSKDG
jgi:hypothetical protein